MHNFFKQQPDAILIEIFKSLSFLDRIKIAQVETRFNKIIKSSPQLAINEEEKSKLPRKMFVAVFTHSRRNKRTVRNGRRC